VGVVTYVIHGCLRPCERNNERKKEKERKRETRRKERKARLSGIPLALKKTEFVDMEPGTFSFATWATFSTEPVTMPGSDFTSLR